MAAHSLPTVQHDMLTQLTIPSNQHIQIGTPDWYTWLSTASKFTFENDSGRFTAYREQAQRGGWYWRAYRRRAGRLSRVYLGKSDQLTPDRLQWAAQVLAGQVDRHPSSIVPPNQREQVSASTPPLIQPNGPVVPWDALIATKIQTPVLHPGLVRRIRLTAQLDPQSGHGLTLISAPAGSGKTTLLSEWSQQTAYQVAWISLDATENDPVRFWRYVHTALVRFCPGLATLPSPPTPPLEELFTLLINTLAPVQDKIVLILDDYQVIQSPAIHQGMVFLLEHLPPCLHIIIASREDPPFPLAHLHARDALLELRAADLRFTSEEIQTFFTEKHHLSLSGEDVSTLSEQTEGWIAGLQLAALSLRGQKDSATFFRTFATGRQRSLADYLLTEVFSQQPETIQTFLLQTSILNRLNSSLCDALTNRSASQTLLEYLERANLFLVPLDEERHWYRYHHLFAEFLSQLLAQRHPEQLAPLHARAADWHALAGFPGEAIRHALAAAEFSLAVRLIEQYAEQIVPRGELVTLRQWVEALPQEALQTSPRLCLFQARALVTSGQMEQAETLLQVAETHLNQRPPLPTEASLPDQSAILGEIAAIRAEIAIHSDLLRAIALSQQALALLPETNSFLRASVAANLGTIYVVQGDMAAGVRAYALAREMSFAAGNMPAVVGSLSSQGYLQQMQGYLAAAAVTFRQAVEIAEAQITPPPLACLAYVGLGRILYEGDELQPATTYLQRALELGQQRDDTLVRIRSLTTLARIKQVRGEVASALDMIEQVDRLAHTVRSPAHAAQAAASCARLWLTQGEHDLAVRWAQASGLRSTDPLSYWREYEYLTLARVLLAEARWEEAALLLERLRSTAALAERGERVLEALVLQAMLFQEQGKSASALEALAEALARGEAGGYLRLFVDEGEPLASLLTRLMRVRRQHPAAGFQQGSWGYLRRVQRSFLQPTARSAALPQEPPGTHQPQILSAREREILRLIAAGCSNQDIAAGLVIESSTVQWHIKQIFNKLDVHRRTQAVARAHAWKLL